MLFAGSYPTGYKCAYRIHDSKVKGNKFSNVRGILLSPSTYYPPVFVMQVLPDAYGCKAGLGE